jgi:hypothetical protein
MAITTPGGKAGRPAVSRLLFQASQALFEEALAPLADDLARRVQTGRDLVIGEPAGGIEHDPGANNVSIR